MKIFSVALSLFVPSVLCSSSVNLEENDFLHFDAEEKEEIISTLFGAAQPEGQVSVSGTEESGLLNSNPFYPAPKRLFNDHFSAFEFTTNTQAAKSNSQGNNQAGRLQNFTFNSVAFDENEFLLLDDSGLNATINELLEMHSLLNTGAKRNLPNLPESQPAKRVKSNEKENVPSNGSYVIKESTRPLRVPPKIPIIPRRIPVDQSKRSNDVLHKEDHTQNSEYFGTVGGYFSSLIDQAKQVLDSSYSVPTGKFHSISARLKAALIQLKSNEEATTKSIIANQMKFDLFCDALKIVNADVDCSSFESILTAQSSQMKIDLDPKLSSLERVKVLLEKLKPILLKTSKEFCADSISVSGMTTYIIAIEMLKEIDEYLSKSMDSIKGLQILFNQALVKLEGNSKPFLASVTSTSFDKILNGFQQWEMNTFAIVRKECSNVDLNLAARFSKGLDQSEENLQILKSANVRLEETEVFLDSLLKRPLFPMSHRLKAIIMRYKRRNNDRKEKITTAISHYHPIL